VITVRFYLRNGTALPDVQCRDIDFTYSIATDKIESYKIHGAFGTMPLYIDCNEIASIYVMHEEE
jgi:hypothetical protein